MKGQCQVVIVHLSPQDSVAIISTGPAQVPHQPLGLLVQFYPYSGLGDTLRLRHLAFGLWQQLRSHIDSAGTPWVVLQATDQTPGPHTGVWQVHNFGFVILKHDDGRWYQLHDTIPFEHPQ